MRRIFVLCLAFLVVLSMFATVEAADSEIVIIEAEGVVSPGMANYLERAIDSAESENANAVILVLDTPGGRIDSMTEIVKTIRSSSVPVAVYVGPAGASAGSAGAFITMAGHVSAMAPETAIGAASPINGDGTDIQETAYNKQVEFLTAEVRSLTERRNPDATELGELMITEARAVSATEALEVGLIDFVSNDVDSLIKQLDGYPVNVNGQTVALETAFAVRESAEPSFIENLQMVLGTNALLLSTLMSIGVMAIITELRIPGGWVSGFVGVICLGVAMYGLGQIEANYLGLGLIAVAFVLFILEAKTPTFGGLAIAGSITMFAGLLVLFNTGVSSDVTRLSLIGALSVTLPTASIFLISSFLISRAQSSKVLTGKQGMIGSKGVTKKDFKPYGVQWAGSVLVLGETWRAVSAEHIPSGTPIRIDAIEGFTVHVSEAN